MSELKKNVNTNSTGDIRWYYQALQFPTSLPVDQWSDKYRYLSAESSAGGKHKWSTDDAPYQREIMRTFTDYNYQIMVLMTSTQVGKALAIETELPTPTGWVRMDDIAIGDTLFDESGQPCRVTFVTPIQYGRVCYAVVFSDGARIVADADHLWQTVTVQTTTQLHAALQDNQSAIIPVTGQQPDDFRPLHATLRYIVSVTPVPSVPVRCIQVDSPSHLYLAGRSMIATHNTEIINNCIGRSQHLDPGPMLLVHPTIDMGRVWVNDRLEPMLRDTPILRQCLSSEHKGGASSSLDTPSQSTMRKSFIGGYIAITGGNAPSGLAARPVRYLFFDDLDRFGPSAGKEGDQVILAMKRTTAFWNRRIVLSSTPGTEQDSRINKFYLQSDQRKYYVPCVHCQEKQVLVFDQLKCDMQGDEYLTETVRYECLYCKQPMYERHKRAMLKHGQWRRHKKQRPTAVGRIAGFWINELYSPWKTWSEVFNDWLTARTLGEEGEKTFRNTSLAEVWTPKGSAPQWETLSRKSEPYQTGVVNDKVLFLTCGIDVQNDRVEMSIYGWGRDEECWLIDHMVLYGNTEMEAVWRQLSKELFKVYIQPSQNRALTILRGCIDTGHRQQQAYRFVRKHDVMFATKGNSRFNARALTRPTKQDVKSTGQIVKQSVNLWSLGVSTIKEQMYSRMHLTADLQGPHYLHYPASLPDDFFKQLTAEQLTTTYDSGYPVYKWKKTYARNEALDCLVLAYAACLIVGIDKINWEQVATPTTQTPDQQKIEDAVKEKRLLLVSKYGTDAVEASPVEQLVPVVTASRRIRSPGIDPHTLSKQYW